MKQTPTQGFRVGTCNGDFLQYNSKCEKVTLKIQWHEFTTDLFVLEIKGSNIVLGVQWLIELGTIMTNYKELTMQFSLGGKEIKIQGPNMLASTPLRGKTLNKLIMTNSISVLSIASD